MLKYFNRLSVFWRVLFLFVFLVFPMYLLSIYITLRGEDSVKSEILKSAASKGSFYISQLETQLSNVMHLQLGILNDKNVQTLQRTDINLNSTEKIYMMNNIRDMLVRIAGMNIYIKEISVYLPQTGRKITTQSIMPLDISEYNTFLKYSCVENLPFSHIENDYYINMTMDFSGETAQPAEGPKTHIVSICISKEVILAGMKDIAGVDGGNVFLIGDGRGLDLAVREDEEFREGIVRAFQPVLRDVNTSDKMDVGHMRYHVFLNPSSRLHSLLAVTIPDNSFVNTLRIFSSWIWILSILTIVLVALFSYWLRGMIVSPLKKLLEALKHAEDDTDAVKVEYSKDDELGHIYRQFNFLVDRLKQLVGDVYKKELMLKDAEFRQLQYQINPHFLHNSLLVVNGLITLEETDAALKLTSHLSSYYQYITKELPGDVELIKEVTHAMDYCEVQNIRFRGRIISQFDELPSQIRDFSVPRLILQPIIENVYKHGLKNKLANGILRVSFLDSDEYIRIIVEDNGDELTDEGLERLQVEMACNDGRIPGTGLKNVHNRLRLRFKQNSGLILARSPLGGLQAILHIYRKG